MVLCCNRFSTIVVGTEILSTVLKKLVVYVVFLLLETRRSGGAYTPEA